ncbi:MAG: peptidoglycan-associated lipoprotein Pal [Kiritimatiellales bacterium]
MKKSIFWLIGLSLVLAVSALTGCKSNKNPAGLYGLDGTGTFTQWDIDQGNVPLGDAHWTGGSEYRGQLQTLYFAYDSSQISAGERGKAEAAANYLKQNSSYRLIVEGHCDERGSREYNLALGERRALAVRNYIVNLGIDAGRIQTKSLGKEQPANPGHDEAAWSQNRRAEFVLYY